MWILAVPEMTQSSITVIGTPAALHRRLRVRAASVSAAAPVPATSVVMPGRGLPPPPKTAPPARRNPHSTSHEGGSRRPNTQAAKPAKPVRKVLPPPPKHKPPPRVNARGGARRPAGAPKRHEPPPLPPSSPKPAVAGVCPPRPPPPSPPASLPPSPPSSPPPSPPPSPPLSPASGALGSACSPPSQRAAGLLSEVRSFQKEQLKPTGASVDVSNRGKTRGLMDAAARRGGLLAAVQSFDRTKLKQATPVPRNSGEGVSRREGDSSEPLSEPPREP